MRSENLFYERSYKMFKALKLSSIIFVALMFIFTLSFSVLQAEAADTEEVVLNISGMTCAGCEGRVKGALTACEGVADAQVSHKDGKAVVQVEKGKANRDVLIEAVKQVGFTATEG